MKEIVIGASIAGWNVQSSEPLDDVSGELVQMRHEETGARLAWLKRRDDNMTFAIAFKTLPDDDTGVAHILEHSVLCGSRKFPVKEPFVDLLKGSFATFLNAWTAPDHTAYPVCSRNRKDFLNLMDVYLDAVFHPLSVENPVAFRQEGWHYERDAATGALKRNGVVYSEMKGALSSPASQAMTESDRLTWRGTPYAFVSGGDPKSIPCLTFEKYCAFYRRHYRPSAAYVFLDGDIDLEPVLAKIGEALSGAPKTPQTTGRTPDNPAARPPARPAKTTGFYVPPAGEDPKDKTIIIYQWVFGRFDNLEERIALKILCSALAESNEEPLVKALLKRGLCENAAMWHSCCEEGAIALLVENAKDGKEDEIRGTVDETLLSLATKGLDRARLEALLARAEFRYREGGSGREPRGLENFIAALDQWLYGGDPAAEFKLTPVFAKLRGRIAEGWFENLLRRAIIDNGRRTETVMKPDASLAARLADDDAAALAAADAAMSDGDRARLERENAALKAFQENDDAPEAKATLPRLRIADIPAIGPVPAWTVSSNGAQTVCRVKTKASGVVYARLFFPLDGLSHEELADVSLATDLLGELDTSRRDATAFKNLADGELGGISAGVAAYGSLSGDGGVPGRGKAFLVLKASALEAKAASIAPIAAEMLRESVLDDPERVGDMLAQQRSDIEHSAGGLGAKPLAGSRALASVSEAGAAGECFTGIYMLRRCQRLDDTFARDGKKTCAAFAALLSRIVSRGAKYVFVSDNMPPAAVDALAAAFPAKTFEGEGARIAKFPALREGFAGAGEVASAAKAAATGGCGGAALVAARMLSLDWLWREIRVRGGAYGGGLAAGADGAVRYNSWNDPVPARSLGIYDASARELRKLAGEDFERYVVGAVAAMEPYLAPAAELDEAATDFLCGFDAEFLQKRRREALNATKEDLLRFADRLDEAAKSASICIVGGKAQVEACKDSLDRIEDIAARRDDGGK